MNPEARKKKLWADATAVELSPSLARTYKVQDRYQVNHKVPPAGMESTLGMALTETTSLEGLPMGLFGAWGLTVEC